MSLRFEAGFVGIHGNIAGLNLLFAGALVGINMLSSQVSIHTYMYVYVILSDGIKYSLSRTRCSPNFMLLSSF